MSSLDRFTGTLESLRAGYEADRLAHAYLVVGAPRTEGRLLAEALLGILFTGERDRARIEKRAHPDVLWIEPESKSRVIVIEQIRQLNKRIAHTAYAGGWKAGILVGADRLHTNAANAFLKTLEEPPPRSVLLLLTDAPQFLLPTIISRCQRITLSQASGAVDAQWEPKVLQVLASDPPGDDLDVLRYAARLKEVLDEVRKAIAEEEGPGDEEVDSKVKEARVQARLLEMRSGLLNTLLQWRRDVLLCTLDIAPGYWRYAEHERVIRSQARRLSVGQALQRVQAVQGIARQLQRNMPAGVVFENDLFSELKVTTAA